MRNRYFARSDGARVDQPFSYASLATSTARATSSGPACAAWASGSAFEGSSVVKYSPERGSTSSPPMKSP